MHDGNHLLASDLDGTLIPPTRTPHDGGIAEFSEAVGAREDLLVAYVTGRHRRLALEGIRLHALPAPHALVCDVGTSLFISRGGEYEPDLAYRELMVSALGGADPESLRRALAGLQGLRPQEEEKQAEFKLSYYTPAGPAGVELARRAEASLNEAGARVNVVYSLDAVADRGLLDVLPSGVAKDAAIRYLHDRSGVSEEALVYAGDSGNDRAAMLSGFKVVVVGNAASDLKESIRAEGADLGLDASIYFAEASYALGVLEGCRHFRIV